MSSKLDNILLMLFHSYDAKGNQLAINDSKQQLKDLFKEIVNSSSQEFLGATGWVKVCPTSLLLEKIEEL